MNILIRMEDNIRIFDSINGIITDENVDFMENYILTMPKEIKCKYAINLHNFKEISKRLIEFIKKFQTMLCCLSADILTYFMLTKAVNYLKVYVSEGDLIEDRRRILKREFRLV